MESINRRLIYSRTSSLLGAFDLKRAIYNVIFLPVKQDTEMILRLKLYPAFLRM